MLPAPDFDERCRNRICHLMMTSNLAARLRTPSSESSKVKQVALGDNYDKHFAAGPNWLLILLHRNVALEIVDNRPSHRIVTSAVAIFTVAKEMTFVLNRCNTRWQACCKLFTTCTQTFLSEFFPSAYMHIRRLKNFRQKGVCEFLEVPACKLTLK